MRRLLVIVLLAAAVLFVGTQWLDQVRASTVTPTPSGLHAFATTAPDGVFSPYPRSHPVEMKPLGDRALELAVSYFKKGFYGESALEEAGEYSMPSGVIRIVSEQVRFEASLPAGLRPDFDRTIRHEYGHAFLFDLLGDKVGFKSKRGVELFLETAKSSPSLDVAWPGGLRPVVREYRHIARNVYQAPYYTSSFAEYLAESYARYGAGQSVPPETRKFLARYVR